MKNISTTKIILEMLQKSQIESQTGENSTLLFLFFFVISSALFFSTASKLNWLVLFFSSK